MSQKTVIAILITCLFGCSEAEYPHKFPLVITEEVTGISATGATFAGRMENLSNFKVIDYGFVWEQDAQPTINSSRLSLSSNIKEGKFSQLIQSDLQDGKAYMVRAFIRTDKVIVYGDTKRFTSNGSLAPTISTFSPSEGVEGTEINISGDNFSTKLEGNHVTIGDVECEVISASKNELIVKLPMNERVGSFQIVVAVAGKTGTSTGKFTIIGPIIESLSKLTARVGDLLTIDGKHFDWTEGAIVHFGKLEYVNWAQTFPISNTSIACYVPDYPNTTTNITMFSYSPEYKIFEFQEPFTIVDSWQKRSEDTPLANYLGFAHAQVNNVVYVMGGRTLYEYNLSTKIWTKKQDFPGAYRFFGTAVALNGMLYYGFGAGMHEPYAGENGQYYNDIWSYNPATNSWASLGNTPLSERSDAVALAMNNKLYFGFGGLNRDLWEYNVVANSWTEVNTDAIGQQVNNHRPAAFVANGKAYFAGLYVYNYPNGSTLWEFDPATNQWTQKAGLTDWVSFSPTVTIGSHGFVICIVNGGVRAYEYDTGRDVWIRRQSKDSMGAIKFGAFYQNQFHIAGIDVWELNFGD